MKVSEKYYDEIFDFAGQWEMPSKCGLKILNYNDKKIVIVTELYQDNPGTSVTYNGPSLAWQICKAKNIRPEEIIYIECNPNTNSKLSFYDEEFFRVDFDFENGIFINPKYKQLSKEELMDIFGKNY
jgi:hypothetical protein